MGRRGTRAEFRELGVGYRWGLRSGKGLDGRTMRRTDKAWHGTRLFMTEDQDVTGTGLGAMRTGMARLGWMRTRIRRLRTGDD
jgi:hypothetical protein